jgi:fatty acid desaturase
MRFSSIKFLLRNKAKYHMLDSLLLAAHFAWYITLIFYLVGGWRAVLFIAVQQGAAGLYMGAGMAANHIGMPMIYQDGEMDGLRQQVVVSRNIKNHPLTDFWYGGLNFQVEHHLFPLMARNKMRAACQIVKRFCEARSITYYEVGVFQSYWEILRHLRKVSAAAT